MPVYPTKPGRIRKYYEFDAQLVERIKHFRERTPELRSEVATVEYLLDEALARYEEIEDREVSHKGMSK